MRLLWRIERTPKRGPKQKLTTDEIVTAAIELADEEGVRARSRCGGSRSDSGVGAMTLYTYVPAKSDLLDLMYDRVIGEYEVSFPESSTWRERLETIARAQWDLYQRPSLDRGTCRGRRVPLGPNILDSYEQAAAAIAGIGLSGKEMTEVLTLVSSYVRGAARIAVEARTLPIADGDGRRRSGGRDVGPVLETIWDPARFPTLSSPEMSHAWEQADDEGGLLPRGGAGLVRVRPGPRARRHRGVHRTSGVMTSVWMAQPLAALDSAVDSAATYAVRRRSRSPWGDTRPG